MRKAYPGSLTLQGHLWVQDAAMCQPAVTDSATLMCKFSMNLVPVWLSNKGGILKVHLNAALQGHML